MRSTDQRANFDRIMRDLIPALADEPTIDDDQDLSEAGLDSIGVVELVLRLEKQLGVRFPDSALDPDVSLTAGHFRHHVEDQLRQQRERRAVCPLRSHATEGRP
ncbi:hypothetical protein GCM10022222_63800 [Amycolatopsis ultiminotia]|uniref:Carrier domain-containing protein n=1 Tax=Amycolatopsis ultiminotia TaxID=543629 RepID=A0ABP6XW23_9PSEU